MILYLQFIDYSDIHTLIHTVHTSGVCYDKLKMYVCHKDPDCYEKLHTFSRLDRLKVITQGKLFLRCTHLLYCSAPSLGGNVDTAWHGIHLSHTKINEIFWSEETIMWIIKIFKNSMLLSFSDTKRKLMHLFLFTNSVQRELVSIFTQSIRNYNYLYLY